MVHKKDLKDYNFDSIEVYFNYILESKINGQYSQVQKLINELSKNQKKQFINYLEFENTEHARFCKQSTLMAI